ncbi:GNAT family N-acetyltransferase [Streptomyces sp. NPDC004111]|uniref:GNAT family N-acetyltransferase n=1 Tax=Streptomyces sp. NPDC004111 TaxID=3364690 RepID=UPI0036B08D3F
MPQLPDASWPAAQDPAVAHRAVPHPEAITTDRLDLLPLALEYAPEMAKVLADPALHTFTGGVPLCEDALRARYERQLRGAPDPGTDWLNWVVRLRGEGRLTGTVQATVTGEVAELAWVVGTDWQGRGIATEAAAGLAGRLAARPGIRELRAHIHPGHRASQAVARALGLRPTDTVLDGEVRWTREVAQGERAKEGEPGKPQESRAAGTSAGPGAAEEPEASRAGAPTVEVRDGTVRGLRPAPGIAAYLGIPYAAPPFGPHRFRAPQPPAPWDGVRDCTAFGPISPQSAELPGAPSWVPGDEDVLTLNVWAPEGSPEQDRGALPVLVWLHGGAYTFGSSAQPDFEGTVPARAGLVVVTVNYRLGFEGFGHLPGGGTGTPYPENRGLLDQAAALRWVRANIAAFGGDPQRVTVAGQSAGATSAVCLMLMEEARGLFRRAVAHSAVGPCISPVTAAGNTAWVAAAAGVPATVEGLLSASPRALVAASDKVSETLHGDPGFGARHHDEVLYGPVADGTTLPADPLAAHASAPVAGIDLLVCHTTEEYWLMDAVGQSVKITDEEQLDSFRADFGLPRALVERYRERLPDAPLQDLYLALIGDLYFAEYSNRVADAHVRAGGRTFHSRFARRRTDADGRVTARAWHCADIPFAFGNHHDPRLAFLIGGPPAPGDDGLSAQLVGAWAAFAATGDPGWSPYDPADEATVRIWGAPAASGPPRELWRAVDYDPEAR